MELKNQLKQNNNIEAEGVEDTDESTSDPISEPFDPTKIDIATKALNIDLLVKRLRSNPSRINLDTEFQRRNDLWKDDKQSRLMESMMIRLPLPVFYFDATNDAKWDVVDGLQRLSTLNNFMVKKSLRLTGLEYLKEYEGKLFDELPEYMKTRIEETEATAYLINPGTPINVKYNIFKRINTSGLVLSPQEIRHAINQGIPASFIKELAELNEFKEATDGAVKPNRMDDRDFVNRFVAFYLTPYTEYRPDLDTFLNSGMVKIEKISQSERDRIKFDFIRAMQAAKAIFGKDAFRKRYYLSDTRSLVNKALFETWSVNLAQLPAEKIPELIIRAELIKVAFMELMHDEIFDVAVSRGTGDIRNVRRRFEAIKNLINDILNVDRNSIEKF